MGGRVGDLHGPGQSSLPSAPGNQEQPEPDMEALLSSSSAFLWWGPRHTHPGEEFTLIDGSREEILGRDFLLALCLFYIQIPPPPLPQVRCSDYDSDGSHDLIGTFHTTLAQLQAVPVSVDC